MFANWKPPGTTHNVFGIQVGTSISIFVRKSKNTEKPDGKNTPGSPKAWETILKPSRQIVRLIGQVITVSLKTVKIVKNRSELK